MANPEHIAKLKEGVDAWNAWRLANPEITCDLRREDLHRENLARTNLSGADFTATQLSNADLTGADLSHAKLHRANLRLAKLRNANLCNVDALNADFGLADLSEANLYASELNWSRFYRANLTGANLDSVHLDDSDLYEANLTAVSLKGADLKGVTFWSNQIDGADLTDAVLGDTSFVAVDLSRAIGLESVHHSRPSALSVETIFLSKGKIPEPFLRGCGVPDDFMVYMKSLVANPIQFYSCFISYSTKDQDFADRLHADLQNKGVRCWFSPHDIQGGKKLHEQIDEAIRLHDKLLLILSPHSMESEWVNSEIAKARKREMRDSRRVLFPIRIAPFETLREWELFDADTGKDSAREIREYFIPDFSNWKDHDSYQVALNRLITDLKSSDAKSK
jgi:uncharacterized protein YjbI with pentapeptide repeats